MIVLHLVRSYGGESQIQGGAEINLENLVNLISNKSNITSLIFSDYGVWVKETNKKIKKIKIIGNLFILKVFLLFKNKKIKNIHVHSNSYLIFIGYFLAFFLRARLIIKITRIGESSLLNRERENITNLKFKIKKYLMQIICKSSFVYLHILTKSGENIAKKISNNLIIFPNIIKEGFYKKEDKIKDSVLISSRIIKRKNIDIAIKKLISLNKKNIFINVVGDGPELEELKAKYKNQKENINFHGYVVRSEIYKYYVKSEYFINLSSSEGMSNALIEAMSFGCKCIVSNIPENRNTAGAHAAYYNFKDDFFLLFKKASILNGQKVSNYANHKYSLNSFKKIKLRELYKI